MSAAPELGLLGPFGDAPIAEIFSFRARIEAYLEIEVALARAQAALGVIPSDAADAIGQAARTLEPDEQRLRDGTRLVGYPILPLLEQLREVGGPLVAAYAHWGATTQDIMDTATAMQAQRGTARLERLLVGVGASLARLAVAERCTVMAGRTHAQPAVPTTFGAKVAVWLAEYARHLRRLQGARAGAGRVSLFGAGGTAAALGPQSRETRRSLASLLGLAGSDVPRHVARDEVVEVGLVLAGIAATGGKLGREVIELSRPEIGEVAEVAGHHRGASSTMPQKANPISSEALVAFQIAAASQVGGVLAATQGTHERASGEWLVEWDLLPLLFGYAGGSLATAGELLDGLTLDRERMAANLRLDGGTIMAEAAMIALSPIVGRGKAHDLVYAACRRVSSDGLDLAAALEASLPPAALGKLPPLEDVLDPAAYLGEADSIVDAAVATWTEAVATAT